MKKIHFVSILCFGVLGLVSCGNNPSPTPPTPPVTITHWYDFDEWWNYCSNNGLEQAVKEDIGKIVNLNVNGMPHKIRLIGIDKDEDSSGNKIHCTFEFANLLSDANGHCLGIQWNDIANNKLTEANYQYSSSTIRSALNDENANNIHWAEKGSDRWSLTYNRSVLGMLKPEFKNALKTTKKIVNEYSLGPDGKYSWVEKSINDKLFLLTPCEMGYTKYTDPDYQESSTSPYVFYENCNVKTAIPTRIKKQVKEEDVGKNSIVISATKGQQCLTSVTSYAGFNDLPNGGGYYFLRSPYASPTNSRNIWVTNYDGSFDYRTNGAYAYGFSIAPAFCI